MRSSTDRRRGGIVIPFKASKRISSMAKILGVNLGRHNDSSLVTPLPTSCYLIEKGCDIMEEKYLLIYFFNYFKNILNTWKLSFNILKQRLSGNAQECTITVTDLSLQNLVATPDLLVIFTASF